MAQILVIISKHFYPVYLERREHEVSKCFLQDLLPKFLGNEKLVKKLKQQIISVNWIDSLSVSSHGSIFVTTERKSQEQIVKCKLYRGNFHRN